MATEGDQDSVISETESVASSQTTASSAQDSGIGDTISSRISRTDSTVSSASLATEPALHTAVCNFDPRQVEDLLALGPMVTNPEERNNKGRNALHEAFMYYVSLHPLDKGLFEKDLMAITTRLITAGIDINAVTQDKKKRSLLHMAASKADNSDLLRMLFASGAKVNALDGFHQAPLHLATTGGHKSNAQALLDGGADANVKDVHGRTPLHLAAKGRNRLELLRLLLKCGAQATALDNLGRKPLHLAAKAARPEVLRELLLHDNDVNIKDGTGQTPAHLAANSDLTGETLKGLLAYNADVNIPHGITGETALHKVVKLNMVESLKLLTKVKADTNAKDVCGETPLHKAVNNDDCIVWSSLLSLGGDPSAENDKGQTARRLVEKGCNKMALGLIKVYEEQE